MLFSFHSWLRRVLQGRPAFWPAPNRDDSERAFFVSLDQRTVQMEGPHGSRLQRHVGGDFSYGCGRCNWLVGS